MYTRCSLSRTLSIAQQEQQTASRIHLECVPLPRQRKLFAALSVPMNSSSVPVVQPIVHGLVCTYFHFRTVRAVFVLCFPEFVCCPLTIWMI